MDHADEIERLRIENEELRAKLILAKGRLATPAIDGRWRGRSPAEQQAGALAARAYVEDKMRRAGFDPASEQGRQAYFAAAYRRARGEPEPAAETTLTGFTRLAEPAVEPVNRVKEPADPLAVYLPKATPEAILRAEAKAAGRLVDLPADETARAILRAAAKANNEPEPGDKPL